MQYQLQYDNEGTASLKEMDVTSTRKVSEGTFKVSDYFAPRIDYGITETYADTFSPEKQLELIQKKLLGKDSGNDKDDSTYKKNLSPEFDWKTYTYNEYVKALGEDVANDWLNYGKIGDIAKLGNWASIVFPVNYIAKGAMKVAGKVAGIQKEKIGPSYGKKITQGTIYDAEDHGEPPNGIMSKPEPVSVPVPAHISGGNNGNQGRSDRSHTGHGKSGMGRNPEDRM